jgi:hypothetical protein
MTWRARAVTAGRWLGFVSALVVTFYVMTLLEAAFGRCP